MSNKERLMDAVERQTSEFTAMNALAAQWRRIQMTAVVDDDYPEVRRGFDSALRTFLDAVARNRVDERVKYATLTIQEFSDRLNAIWEASLRTHVEDVAIPAMGLCGEAAEVSAEVMIASGRASEHFKKHIRDGKPIVGNTELAYELGDVLHYWCRLTKLAGYTPADIMRMNEEKLAARRAAKAAK